MRTKVFGWWAAASMAVMTCAPLASEAATVQFNLVAPAYSFVNSSAVSRRLPFLWDTYGRRVPFAPQMSVTVNTEVTGPLSEVRLQGSYGFRFQPPLVTPGITDVRVNFGFRLLDPARFYPDVEDSFFIFVDFDLDGNVDDWGASLIADSAISYIIGAENSTIFLTSIAASNNNGQVLFASYNGENAPLRIGDTWSLTPAQIPVPAPLALYASAIALGFGFCRIRRRA